MRLGAETGGEEGSDQMGLRDSRALVFFLHSYFPLDVWGASCVPAFCLAL